MKVVWYGHACFLLESKAGTKVVTDPFDPQIGYSPPRAEASFVTVSHAHFDHNAVKFLRGNPVVFSSPGEYTAADFRIKGIATFHDALQGKQRGKNTVFVLEAEGLRFCHLGDLGHQLSPAQQEELGRVDVLFVPVGGTFTIDAAEAFLLVEKLKPAVVVPMHYRLPKLTLSLGEVESFTSRFPKEKVQRVKGAWEVEAATLPEPITVLVFEPPAA